METPHPVHFLLVEDDDDHAELMLRTLRQHHVTNTIDRVGDGQEAIAYLRRQPPYDGKRRPDVVLLDLNMPRVGGHEVLEVIKGDAGLRAIPVVVLTTSDAESDRARAYAHFVNSYLVKPVDFQRFSQMIEELSLYWSVWNRPSP
jgi:CheY-like chemotaxis protein